MFFNTNRGYLNSAFVKTVERRSRTTKNSFETYRDIATDVDDREHAIYGDVEHLDTQTIVPAHQPMTLLDIFHDGEEICVLRHPIIAWRIEAGGYPTPVAVGCREKAVSNNMQFIETPHGFYEADFEASFCHTVEECCEVVRQKIKNKMLADERNEERRAKAIEFIRENGTDDEKAKLEKLPLDDTIAIAALANRIFKEREGQVRGKR